MPSFPPLQLYPGKTTPSPSAIRSLVNPNWKTWTIGGLALGGVVVLAFSCVIVVALVRMRCDGDSGDDDGEDGDEEEEGYAMSVESEEEEEIVQVRVLCQLLQNMQIKPRLSAERTVNQLT